MIFILAPSIFFAFFLKIIYFNINGILGGWAGVFVIIVNFNVDSRYILYNKEGFMSAESNPFGISLADIEAFDRAQENLRVHNCPVRDADKESFWDFMSSPEPDGDSVFTPELLDFFAEERY